MSLTYRIGLLDPKLHDRAAFSCTVAPLDTYLHERASQDVKRNVAVVYVMAEEGTARIIGYSSLCTCSIETTHLPESLTKNLPRYDALPGMLLGRLAVDARYQGQRMGTRLLADALQRCVRLSTAIAAMAVLVDAKDDHAAHFYEHFGFQRFADRPLSLFMTMLELRRTVT